MTTTMGLGVSDGDGVGGSGGGSPLKIRLNINELSLPTAHHLRLGIHAFLSQWLRVGGSVRRKVCWCKINAGERKVARCSRTPGGGNTCGTEFASVEHLK